MTRANEHERTEPRDAHAPSGRSPLAVPTDSGSASFIHPDDGPLGRLAQAYLDALLGADRAEASRLIMEAVEGGAEVRDVYLRVFQPAQWEIGRLWELNRVSVAQEHFCTAATQMIMSQLYPRIFATPRRDARATVTCVGGDLHEIGARMVSDLLEMDGWDTYYVGADAPAESVVTEIAARRAGLLAISATIAANIPAVESLIRMVRAHPFSGRTSILVGGAPFNASPELWREVGADGTARDAAEAVRLAERIIERRAA